jgi:hypothetical protein
VTDATLALFDVADTLPQCGLQVDRPAVLWRRSAKASSGQLLEVPHAVPCEQVESVQV